MDIKAYIYRNKDTDLAGNLKHISHQADCSERVPYISLKLTASVEWTDGGVV